MALEEMEEADEELSGSREDLATEDIMDDTVGDVMTSETLHENIQTKEQDDQQKSSKDISEAQCEKSSSMLNEQSGLQMGLVVSESNKANCDTDRMDSKFVDSLEDELNCLVENSSLDFGNEEQLTKKNKARKKNKNKHLPMPEDIASDPEMRKYWAQRYRLFSRFDEGIKMDRGG